MKLKSYIAALNAALFCILLAASPAGSGSMTLLGAGKAGSAAYAGPGDSQTFVSWGSVARTYDLAHASTATSLADLVASTGGAAVCTLRGSSTGLVDLAASYCAGTTPALACAAASGGSCKVTKLYDQPGANHWVQATLAKMPALVFSGINGLPSMSFTSASVQVLSSTSNIASTLQPYTFEAVAERTANVTTSQDIMSHDANDTELAFNNSASSVYAYAGAGPLTDTATDSVAHVLQGTYNGASGTLNVDGRTQITGNIGADGFGGTSKIWIGGFASGVLSLDGLVSEVGMYAATYSAGVQSNARTAYGL